MAAWIWLGFDLRSDLMVLHHCDNRLCFRPKHLFVGTAVDNMQDRRAKGGYAMMKGLTPVGERHGMTTLTTQEVLAIRASTARTSELVKTYGVSKSTVLRLRRRATWKHV